MGKDNNDSYWEGKMKRTIRETPAMPEALRSYIMELKDELKAGCTDNYFTATCDGRIGEIIGLIEKIISANKEKQMSILENRGDYTPEKIAEEGAKIISKIARKVWNSEEIIRVMEAFVNAVKSWRAQALVREENLVPRRYHNQSLKTEGVVRQKKVELVDKIESICQEVIDGIVQRYTIIHQNPGEGENPNHIER